MGRSLGLVAFDLNYLNRCYLPGYFTREIQKPCGGSAMRLDAFMIMKKMSGVLTLVIVLTMNVFWTAQANAQVSGATLSGTVMDSSGAVIPNAQVRLTDVGTGVTRNVTSGSAGFYTAPNLLPATYEVRVTAPGFSTQVQKGVTLTVGAQQTLDIKMQVGQV